MGIDPHRLRMGESGERGEVPGQHLLCAHITQRALQPADVQTSDLHVITSVQVCRTRPSSSHLSPSLVLCPVSCGLLNKVRTFARFCLHVFSCLILHLLSPLSSQPLPLLSPVLNFASSLHLVLFFSVSSSPCLLSSVSFVLSLSPLSSPCVLSHTSVL